MYIENNVIVNKENIVTKDKKRLEKRENEEINNVKIETTNTPKPSIKKIDQKIRSNNIKPDIKSDNTQARKLRSSFRAKAVTFNKSEIKKKR